MVIKTLGKIIGIWLSCMAVFAVAVLAAFALFMIWRFKIFLVAIAIFLGIGYILTEASGVEVKTKPRYRCVKGSEDMNPGSDNPVSNPLPA